MARIAQCMIWYLRPTMGYIYDQLVELSPDRSIVLAVHPDRPERFPFPRVYIQPPDDGSMRLSRRASFFFVCDRLFQRVALQEDVGALHVHDGRISSGFLPLAR